MVKRLSLKKRYVIGKIFFYIGENRANKTVGKFFCHKTFHTDSVLFIVQNLNIFCMNTR